MAALWELGAADLGRLIAERETTSREVLEALRERIDTVNASVNAVVELLDSALPEADAADRAIAAGHVLGPLHGVPFSAKINIDVAGSATSSGVAALASAVAPDDAPVIERLRAAGAIPFARSNMADLGLRNHTWSSLHGRTLNPWSPDVTAGGSSGGEAAALATGMSPLGLGNDIAGSVRNPAHCCGIASLKPSTGVIPQAASLPPTESTVMYQLMLVQGLMARCVEDLRTALLAVAGPHRRDPLALPLDLQANPSSGVPRIAIASDPPGSATDAGIAHVVRQVADALADAGCQVAEAVPGDLEPLAELFWALCTPDFRAIRPEVEAVLDEASRTFIDHIEQAVPVVSTTDLARSHLQRNREDQRWHAFLTDWDVLLLPASPWAPQPHDTDIASPTGAASGIEVLRPLLPANLFGLPAAVVPGGLDAGMPVGVQVVARRGADLTTLRIAELIEQAVGTLTPIEPRSGAPNIGRSGRQA